ncbi:MAG: Rieske 2Fe-2S domain-containing protein [Sandaracinaceae bacterium]
MTTETLTSLSARGSSVSRVTRAWYIACRSEDLGHKPLSRTILDQPMVLFRGTGGRPGALLDRCPHRNVPLSLGAVRGGQLECSYHGWRFDEGGACKLVPALCATPGKRNPLETNALDATSFPAREQDGFVWVWADATSDAEGEPFHFPLLDASGYATVREHVAADASLHAVAENALDVPHTAFLHAGLFRSDEGTRNPIEVVVRRWSDRVEAEYIGEPRPEGLVGRFLAPQGGVVEHFDRFLLPSIVQVEYRLGDLHLLVCAALTPESDYRTHLWAVVSFTLPVPAWAVVPVLKPVALRIFGQDAKVLARQTETIRRFGGEQYVSTELDVLGPHILRLLRAAERGKVQAGQSTASPDADPNDDKPTERRVTMEV